MSCARCSQSNTLFPEATSVSKPKTLDPLSGDTTVLRLGRERARARRGTVEDPWNTTEKRSLHIDYSEGGGLAPGGLSVRGSRSSNHHVCLFNRIKTRPFLHTSGASERPTEGKCRSLPLSKDETQKRAPTKTGEATPLHTSTPSPRARRRDRPAPRVHALFERTARRPRHTSNPQPSSHSKK